MADFGKVSQGQHSITAINMLLLGPRAPDRTPPHNVHAMRFYIHVLGVHCRHELVCAYMHTMHDH